MKMNECIKLIVAGFFFILIVNVVGDQSKDELILDSIISDNVLKSKRPFCNAFTGCGKKRNYHDKSMEHVDNDELITIRVPILLYRALIRVATREIRDDIERSSNIDKSILTDAVMDHDYSQYSSTRKLPIRKRFDS